MNILLSRNLTKLKEIQVVIAKLKNKIIHKVLFEK